MADVLTRIQNRLSELYDVDSLPVAPFICSEEEARAAVGDAVSRGEVLLVSEDADGGISVGLYVAESALDLLRSDDAPLEAFWLAAEGVSHFVYLIFRAQNEESVTQLELELQAEVDKYATALLDGWGVGLMKERSRQIRRRLFDDAEFLDDAGTEEGDRYRTATRAAARVVANLEQRFVAREDLRGLVGELRRFYRLGRREKLAYANER